APAARGIETGSPGGARGSAHPISARTAVPAVSAISPRPAVIATENALVPAGPAAPALAAGPALACGPPPPADPGDAAGPATRPGEAADGREVDAGPDGNVHVVADEERRRVVADAHQEGVLRHVQIAQDPELRHPAHQRGAEGHAEGGVA